MGTISLTLPADGETADASDVNNPFNTIAAVINGGIDADNIEAGGVIPNGLQSGTGTSWAWQSWTPTLSGLFNNTKWDKTARYIQIGKTVFFYLNLVANTTTPMDGAGEPTFTLPVTATNSSPTIGLPLSTYGAAFDANGSSYIALVEQIIGGTTTARVRYIDTGVAAGSAKAAITTTAPFTWTTSDVISVQGFYEAA